MRQILLNLLGNAIKFTDQGQVTLKVNLLGITASQDNDPRLIKLRFEIQDTGIGMKPKQLEKIFRPYEQVGESRRRSQGTGLGLAITRQLINLMGGELQVDSHPSQGSRFWFEVSFPAVESVNLKVETDRNPIIGYEGKRRKILIADDRLENRWVLQGMLESLGFTLQIAENGQEAIEQTQIFRPDLILMDLMMPVIDGFEATHTIRTKNDLSQPKITVVSAKAFSEDRQRAFAAGCDGYLVKPVDESLLYNNVQKQLSLTWLYEHESNQEVKMVELEALFPPPKAILNSLYELAMIGDMIEIREQTEELLAGDDQYQAFTHKLIQLANSFEDEAILALLESYLQEEI